MISGHRPLWSSASTIFSREALAGAGTWNFSYSIAASAAISMAVILRRSPRRMAETVPLTGAVNRICGRALSKNSGVPAFTFDPSETSSLGVMPGKLSGTTAQSSPAGTCTTVFSASPTSRMSRPRFSLMTFDMLFNEISIS